MFYALDTFLLDKIFEPLSVWITDTFGVGVYTLSKWFLLLSAVGTIVHLGVHGVAVLMKTPLEILGAAFMVTLISVFAVKASAYEERYHRRLSSALPPNERNATSLTSSFRRMSPILVLLSVIGRRESQTLFWVDLVTDIALVLGLYFLACTPRPPKRKQVSKLSELPV